MQAKGKLGLFKWIKLNWFNVCPQCNAKITTFYYSFLDMKNVCKCDKCGSMYE